MHPLDSILDRWRQEEAGALFSRTHAMGIAFEDLCAAFLTHDPIQSLELQDAKTFADWARERDLNQTDTGDALLRRVAAENGLRVHGVLWVVDELEAARSCARSLLVRALKDWQGDDTVFLPPHEVSTRLEQLREAGPRRGRRR